MITSKEVPNYLLIACAFAGAFIGFLIPTARPGPPLHPGILSAVIAFELNYVNLITTFGAVVLVYWLVVRKVRGREAMIVCGGLGLVTVKLVLASLDYFRKL
jgi:hypothetical protein